MKWLNQWKICIVYCAEFFVGNLCLKSKSIETEREKMELRENPIEIF